MTAEPKTMKLEFHGGPWDGKVVEMLEQAVMEVYEVAVGPGRWPDGPRKVQYHLHFERGKYSYRLRLKGRDASWRKEKT